VLPGSLKPSLIRSDYVTNSNERQDLASVGAPLFRDNSGNLEFPQSRLRFGGNHS
jgi:hypothetical protein